jgi:hypothetical protein
MAASDAEVDLGEVFDSEAAFAAAARVVLEAEHGGPLAASEALFPLRVAYIALPAGTPSCRPCLPIGGRFPSSMAGRLTGL